MRSSAARLLACLAIALSATAGTAAAEADCAVQQSDADASVTASCDVSAAPTGPFTESTTAHALVEIDTDHREIAGAPVPCVHDEESHRVSGMAVDGGIVGYYGGGASGSGGNNPC